MKILIGIILTFSIWGGFNDIATINAIKKQAKEAYNNGDYQYALSQYKLLSDSLGVRDESIQLNLANAYFKVNDTTSAVNTYSSLLSSKDNSIKSVAHQQLGVIKNRAKQYKEALNHFKESLKADPANKDSRYNYELLKKVLKEQEQNPQNNQDQNKDQKEKQDQEKKEQQNKEQQKENEQKEKQDREEQKDENKEEQNQAKDKKEGDEQKKEEQKSNQEEGESKEDPQQSDKMPSVSDKLKEMKISEEKARMILEAMKNNEIQYLQQNKRKATKKKDPDKPDW